MFKDEFVLTDKASEKESAISKVTSEDFWKDLRPGVYNDGLITFCDIENYGWSTLEEWTEVVGPKVMPVAFNAWGDVFLISFHEKIEAFLLFPQDRGQLELGTNPFVYFDALLSDEGLSKTFLDVDRFKKVKQRHGPLSYGQCYVLQPYESLGGNPNDLEAYDKATATIYWSLVSQV